MKKKPSVVMHVYKPSTLEVHKFKYNKGGVRPHLKRGIFD